MLTLTSPLPNQVYQRNSQGRAYVSLAGTVSADVLSVEVVLRPRKAGTFMTRTLLCANGQFAGDIILMQGDYNLIVTSARQAGLQSTPDLTQVVGVGDIFCIAGHSVSAGDDRNGTAGGALDDRVFAVAIDGGAASFDQYKATANPDFLPTAIVPYGEHVIPGPFGSGTNFWARFGDAYVTQNNVPILILNAAFGGTNIEQWAKSTQGLPFVHGFVNWQIRMPYINLKNCFLKYTSVSGIKGLLMDHGANDWLNTDYEAIFGYFKRVIEQVRTDSGQANLVVVLARHTPFGKTGIRTVQERVIREVPNVFAGPDYDAIPTQSTENSVDTIHLTVAGQTKVAAAWGRALPPDVVALMPAYQPKPVSIIVPDVMTAAPDTQKKTIAQKLTIAKQTASWLPVKRGSIIFVVVLALLAGVLGYTLGRRSVTLNRT